MRSLCEKQKLLLAAKAQAKAKASAKAKAPTARACEDATSGIKGAVVLTVRECCQGYCLVCACEERAALNVGAVCLFML